MNKFNEQHKSLIKEANKQSKKLINISDKGYNVYRLCLHFTTNSYNINKGLQHIITPKQDWWEGLELDANRVEHNHLWKRLVFFAPKNIDITLDNILEYCTFNYGWNSFIPYLFGKKLPPYNKNYPHWTEYKFNTSPVLEKIENGKIPENVFNYILSRQKMFNIDNNKISIIPNRVYEIKEYEWESKAVNKILKLFNQNSEDIYIEERDDICEFKGMYLMTIEEYNKKTEEVFSQNNI